MLVQGSPANHPSHPIERSPTARTPAKPRPTPTARHAPAPRPAKPAPTSRATHPKPRGRRTAGRYELTMDGTALVLIGMKIDGHIQ